MPPTSASLHPLDRSPTSFAYHAACLALAVGILAAACALEVLPGERVALRGLPQYPLPHVCFSRAALGVPCPGCGLTRSFIHLAHGNWRAAWRVHHVGGLLFAVVCLQIPYRGALLAGLIRRTPGAGELAWFAVCLVVLLLAHWVWRMLAGL